MSLPSLLLIGASVAALVQDPVREMVLLPELRIGSAHVAGHDLTPVTSLAVNNQGTMYVAQPLDHRVRVFDDRGRFVRDFGGDGAGPGEFRSISRVGVLNGVVWVSDGGLRRLSFFKGSGEFLTSVRVPGSGMVGPLDDGSIFLAPHILGPTGPNDPPTLSQIIRLDTLGQVLDTLAHVIRTNSELVVNLGPVQSISTQPFGDDPLIVGLTDGSGVLIVEGRVPGDEARASFQVTTISTSRDTAAVWSFAYEPKPLTSGVVDRLVDRMLAGMSATAPRPFGRASVADDLRDALFTPEFLPPITHVVPGIDGTTWLRREDDFGGTVQWNVIDRSGNMVATFDAPWDLRILAAGRGKVWAVEQDDLGIPYILRLRLEAANLPNPSSERGRRCGLSRTKAYASG